MSSRDDLATPVAPKKTRQSQNSNNSGIPIVSASILILTVISVLGSLLGSDLLWTEFDAVTRSSYQEFDSLQAAYDAGVLRTSDPISLASYYLETKLPGSPAFKHRTINLTLHLGSALLFFALLRNFALKGALATALIFALHPCVVQPIFWPGYRPELIGLFFTLLAINCFLRKDSKSAYLLCLLTTGIAVIGHNAALSIPIICALITYFKQRHFNLTNYNRILPIFCIALLIAIWSAPEPSPIGIETSTPTATLSHASENFFFYFKQALAPTRPALFYHYNATEHTHGNLALGVLPFVLVIPFYIIALFKFRYSWSRALILSLTSFLLLLTPGLLSQGWNLDGSPAHEDYGLYIALPALMALIIAGSRAVVAKAELAGAGLWYSAVGLILTIEILTSGALAYTLGDQQRMWTLQSEQWPNQWQPKAALVAYVDTQAPGALTTREKIQLLEEIIKKQPDRWNEQHRLLDCYLEVGERNNALRRYRYILSNGNPDTAFRIEAADYLSTMGFTREAAAVRRKINQTTTPLTPNSNQ